MRCERIFRDDTGTKWIDTYLQEPSCELKPNQARAAVLVCPGGGYKYLSDREAEPIALTYAAMGYHAFVLHYGVDSEACMPGPIKDIAWAMAYIKRHSDEWLVDRDHIFVAGFSAGGHLAASLGVFWNSDEILPEYADARDDIRPAGMILGYPVIDLKSTATALDIGIEGCPEYEDINYDMVHKNVRLEDIFVRDYEKNKTYINFEVAMNAYMFNGYPTDEDICRYSLTNQVTPDTVPAFIWHGGEDGLIYPRNSVNFAKALVDNGVKCELHLFASGGHGLALSNEITANNFWEIVPECEPWVKLSESFIKSFLRQQ